MQSSELTSDTEDLLEVTAGDLAETKRLPIQLSVCPCNSSFTHRQSIIQRSNQKYLSTHAYAEKHAPEGVGSD